MGVHDYVKFRASKVELHQVRVILYIYINIKGVGLNQKEQEEEEIIHFLLWLSFEVGKILEN